MVLPLLTLMSVAKPWMVESPLPLTSHSVLGLPGRQFSATMAFAGASQGPAAPSRDGIPPRPWPKITASISAAIEARCRYRPRRPFSPPALTLGVVAPSGSRFVSEHGGYPP